MSNFPFFYVVGAAKSGTTALWNYFQLHPDIFVTKDIKYKELGYFSNQYGLNDRERYLSHFSSAFPNQKVGEVCHAYLSSKESAELIRTEVPNAKIIIMLRNPIDRAYSLYNWMTMEGYESISSFETALKKEKDRVKSKQLHEFVQNYMYFSSGLYYEQVKQYFETFGESNVLVMAYEDFNKDQLSHLNKIYKFLEVSTLTELENIRVNKSRVVRYVWLQYFLRSSLLKTNKMWLKKKMTRLMQFNVVNKKPKEMSQQLRKELTTKYEEDVERLSHLCSFNFVKLWFE